MTTTLLDLLDHAVTRYGDRHALGIRRDDGTHGPLDAIATSIAAPGSPRGGCGRWTWSPAIGS